MQKDGVKTSKVDYRLTLGKEANIVSMIGRSVLLERSNHPDKIYVGQIYPVQPESCKKVSSIPLFVDQCTHISLHYCKYLSLLIHS